MNEDSSVVNRAISSAEKCVIRNDIIMGYLLNTVQYSDHNMYEIIQTMT